MTNRIQKNNRAIAARLKTAVDNLLRPAVPDVRPLAALTVRGVERRLERLSAADERHRRARAAVERVRRQRDHSAERLRERLLQARQLSRCVFGRDSTPLIPLRGNAPLAPRGWSIPWSSPGMLRLADTVAVQLRAPGFRWPEVAGVQVATPPADLAAGLEEPANGLRAALDRLEEKLHEAWEARGERDRAADRFNADLGASVRIVESLAALAGQPELGGWIRGRKGHRRSRRR